MVPTHSLDTCSWDTTSAVGRQTDGAAGARDSVAQVLACSLWKTDSHVVVHLVRVLRATVVWTLWNTDAAHIGDAWIGRAGSGTGLFVSWTRLVRYGNRLVSNTRLTAAGPGRRAPRATRAVWPSARWPSAATGEAGAVGGAPGRPVVARALSPGSFVVRYGVGVLKRHPRTYTHVVGSLLW